MSIISEKDLCHGKPCVKGTRLWVGFIVGGLETSIMEYIKQFPTINKRGIEEALDYCRRQQCENGVVAYCQSCSKSEGTEDLWKRAEQLYQKYFGK